MSRDVTNEQIGSLWAVTVLSGFFAGIGLFFTLSALGLLQMEAAVFAVLSGFTLGAFVYRERSLTSSNQEIREKHRTEVANLEKRIQYYYDHSLVCLAYFDAGTLLIEKVSPGFLQLLRIPADFSVRGNSIVDLLRISSSKLEKIVSDAKQVGATPHVHLVVAEDAQGSQVTLEVSARYYRDAHMVEMAILVSPSVDREDLEDVDIARKDLDRFRRGMYRRETRILELKEEVNQILKDSGQEPRYRFDQNTEDTHVPMARFTDSGGGS
ncbi:hypothetical protein DDZ13_09950 [Coraliomargarita sinensis]|uniref:Uncharacterized protein n=1 Tax=Coraliomargarita sinensis TaxID=2174842 RepID=A0A317ZKT4_9BACT|nr:hypothetical protein [Coraliomargarita sinensis]PXA03951.1 hypothetical protein DDZ13_09950 [Coraliomargarita sinensis]